MGHLIGYEQDNNHQNNYTLAAHGFCKAHQVSALNVGPYSSTVSEVIGGFEGLRIPSPNL